MVVVPKDAFRIFTDTRGTKRIHYIDPNGVIIPLVPKPEHAEMTDGYYSRDFKLISASKPPAQPGM